MEAAREGNKQAVEKALTEVEKITGAEELEEKKPESGKAGIKEEGNAGKKEEVKEEETEEGVAKGSKSETEEFSSPRPTRERKMVERFTVHAPPKSFIPKHVFIDKGRGAQLKDIPNVAFKLSKRKADENLHLLHTILFGKKAKVHSLKKNIGQFSGFVWVDNEGKQRAKIKEKIDKCVKEKLLDFCDVLNIPVSKATVKKEELSAKLLEFLESPHATTDVLLADKEKDQKGKKRKSNDQSSKSPGSSNVAGGKSTKKHKQDSESEKKRNHSTEEEDDNKSERSQSEDDNNVSGAESDEKGTDSEKETDEDQAKTEIVAKTSSSEKSTKKDTGGSSEKSKVVDKKIPAKASNASGKSTKGSTSSASKSKKEALSTEKQKSEKDTKMDTSPPAKVKGSSKSSTKNLKTDQGEGNSSKKAIKEPTVEEMQAVVENLLKEVDFNTATLSDILRKLGEHFGLDLMDRKSEVRDIITEVLQNMPDDEDDSESEDESGEDGNDA